MMSPDRGILLGLLAALPFVGPVQAETPTVANASGGVSPGLVVALIGYAWLTIFAGPPPSLEPSQSIPQ